LRLEHLAQRSIRSTGEGESSVRSKSLENRKPLADNKVSPETVQIFYRTRSSKEENAKAHGAFLMKLERESSDMAWMADQPCRKHTLKF
jgi:hypothetical protein